MPNNPVRLECYSRIEAVMKNGVSSYYRKRPELIGDDRSQNAIKESVIGLQAIFAVLDDYDIVKKK